MVSNPWQDNRLICRCTYHSGNIYFDLLQLMERTPFLFLCFVLFLLPACFMVAIMIFTILGEKYENTPDPDNYYDR